MTTQVLVSRYAALRTLTYILYFKQVGDEEDGNLVKQDFLLRIQLQIKHLATKSLLMWHIPPTCTMITLLAVDEEGGGVINREDISTPSLFLGKLRLRSGDLKTYPLPLQIKFTCVYSEGSTVLCTVKLLSGPGNY